MTYFTKAFLGLGTALFMSASAQAGEVSKPTHVVELFTSQGCSSCPPANRFVGKVAADNPDALVLSYGVTYWDYLGWKDTFGSPEFTKRQRDYRDAFGAPNIYTPQIILGGAAHSPRYKADDVASMPIEGGGVELVLSSENGRVKISANAPKNAMLDIVTYQPGVQDVAVKRGENGGRTLTLTNVVTDVQSVKWDGRRATINLTPQDGYAYAALVHDGVSAKILDATVLK